MRDTFKSKRSVAVIDLSKHSKNGTRSFTPEEIFQINKAYFEGRKSFHQVAADFKTSGTMLNKILVQTFVEYEQMKKKFPDAKEEFLNFKGEK